MKRYLRVRIAKECPTCKETMTEIENGIKHGKVIILKPDYTASGILARYHLMVINETNINYEAARRDYEYELRK